MCYSCRNRMCNTRQLRHREQNAGLTAMLCAVSVLHTSMLGYFINFITFDFKNRHLMYCSWKFWALITNLALIFHYDLMFMFYSDYLMSHKVFKKGYLKKKLFTDLTGVLFKSANLFSDVLA